MNQIICDHFDCQAKAELGKVNIDLEKTTKERDELNNQLTTIQGLLDTSSDSIKHIFEDILKDKKLDKITLDELQEKLNKSFDGSRISEIINNNLELGKKVHSSIRKIMELENDLLISKQEIGALRNSLEERDRSDIRNINELRNMGTQILSQDKTFRSNKTKLDTQEKEIRANQEFITQRQNEIKVLREEHFKFLNELKQFKGESETYRKEIGVYKKFSTRKIRVVNAYCKQIKRYIKKGKDDKALKTYTKAKDMYLSMNSTERFVTSSIFDEVTVLVVK